MAGMLSKPTMARYEGSKIKILVTQGLVGTVRIPYRYLKAFTPIRERKVQRWGGFEQRIDMIIFYLTGPCSFGWRIHSSVVRMKVGKIFKRPSEQSRGELMVACKKVAAMELLRNSEVSE